MTTTHPTRSLRLAGALLGLWGVVGCAAIPGATTPASRMAPPDVTWLDAPTGTYVADRVIVKRKGGQAIRSIMGLRSVQAIDGLADTAIYQVPAGSTVAATLASLRQDPAVAYAEPDYIYHAFGDLHARATVNDPMLSQLWGIAKMQVPQAWDTTTGDPAIVVAVVDTGVDYNHADLKGQVIKGPDVAGNDSDPMDDQGHGSHVAGTIAALGNNGVGVVGVAYHTKILAVKVLGSDGSGDTSTIARGILKAAELGARVINLSLGGPQQSSTLKDAVDQATAKGALVVVAAGNDGNSTVNYPAGYPNALSVGATDRSDVRASFSQNGSTLDLAAPGKDIMSSTEGSYKSHSGTSMASPHVAGAAALLLAKNSKLTVQQLRDALTSTGDPTTGFSTSLKRVNAAKALAAVTGAAPAPAPTPAPSSPVPGTPAPTVDTQAPTVPTGLKALAASTTMAQVEWNASTDDTGVGGYRIYRDGELLATVTGTSYQDSNLSPGRTYAYSIAAVDEAGNASAQANPVNLTTPSSSTQLTLSSIALRNLARTSATLTWKTSIPADGRVDYTPSAYYYLGYWLNQRSSEQVTDHALTLPGLTPGTIYYLKITSTTPAGARVTAGIYGFRTPL